MTGRDFILDCVHLLYYKCQRINPNRGGSCKGFPDCIKTKKEQQIPPIKKKKCFQYNVTVALNHE